MDEITAYWQKALGKSSVLGQASNQPLSRQREYVPDHVCPNPTTELAQPKQTGTDPSKILAEREGYKTERNN